MAKNLIMDEFHITVYVQRGLSPLDYDAIRQALDDMPFQADLLHAVRGVFRRHPPLDKVRVWLTR